MKVILPLFLLLSTPGFTQYEITPEILNHNLQADELVVVEYYSSECHICEEAQPIYEALAKKYGDQVVFLQVDIAKANVDYGIYATPTYQFINAANTTKNGELWDAYELPIEGFPGKVYLEEKIKGLLEYKHSNYFSKNIPNYQPTALIELIKIDADAMVYDRQGSGVFGNFIDPGPPNAFQVMDFCDFSKDNYAFTGDAEKVVLKFMDTKIFGFEYEEGKKITDQPYAGFIKKYLHLMKCFPKDVNKPSLREENSLFKYVIDIGQLDYFANYYFPRCDPDLPENIRLDANQYEIINGKKETILDFMELSIEKYKERPKVYGHRLEEIACLKQDLIRHCNAKRGAELD
ncbi:MAG: thioredoxin family protein [Leeuwenhoekiella sp.]